jgi:nitrite reductase (NADH) small subunit
MSHSTRGLLVSRHQGHHWPRSPKEPFMPQTVRVASVQEIPPGSSREVMVGDQIVAIYNCDGQFHALDGVCPHAGGPLAQGVVRGTTVTCPWHGWQFDVCTGQNKLNPRMSHKRYDVEVQGDDVVVVVS